MRERDFGEDEREGLRDPVRDEGRDVGRERECLSEETGCERERLGLRGNDRKLEFRLKDRWTADVF